MNERKFQKELITSFRLIFGERGYICKVPDFFINPQEFKDDSKTRFMPKRPFDLFGFVDGLGFAIELKFTRARRWRLDNVKPHQIKNLVNVKKSNANSFIILLRETKKVLRAFIIDPDIFIAAISTEIYMEPIISFDLNNLTFPTLEKGSIHGKLVWDLSFLQVKNVYSKLVDNMPKQRALSIEG